MFSLIKSNNSPIGLDISDISLRMMQFGAGQNGLKSVLAYTDIAVPKQAVVDDVVKNPRILTAIIREGFKKPTFGKFAGNLVVASIPETKSFVRVIDMPLMSESEAREAVPWEAEQYVPMPIGQVYLDWVILKQSADQENRRMKVFLNASPRDFVDDQVGYMKEAGLQPVALEVESQATARSLIPSDRGPGAYLILDINAIRSSFIVYDEGTLQFTSSIPIAGNSFTDAIAKVMNVPFEKAEQIKRKIGLEKEAESGMLRKALLPVLNNLVSEIRKTLKFFEEQSGGSDKIKALILTGGSGKLKDLPSYLSRSLRSSERSAEHKLKSFPGLEVELGNPWQNILSKKQTPPLSRTDSLSFSTAIGLALRELEE